MKIQNHPLKTWGTIPMAKLPTNSKGQSLVEFALVFPFYAIITMATFQLIGIVYQHNALYQATRAGLRAAVIQEANPGSVPTLVVPEVKKILALYFQKPDDSTTTLIDKAGATQDSLTINVKIPIRLLGVGAKINIDKLSVTASTYRNHSGPPGGAS